MADHSVRAWIVRLDCDDPNHKPDAFETEYDYQYMDLWDSTRAEAKECAKREGWVFKRGGIVICPRCARRDHRSD